jgi:Uma2 family endonuclease
MAIAERELLFPSESVRSYHWTREQFYQMGEAGLFQGQQVELIEGEILLMPAMGPLHRGMVTIIGDLLRTLFGDSYFVSSQGPFEAGRQSDPEPDIAIIRGNPRDYLLIHPSSAALIVEVSHTTLPHDRNLKASLYAWSGVNDYWIAI